MDAKFAKTKPHIEFTERSVIKWGPPEAIAVEAAKTRRACELGRSSGLFRAPRVLAHDVAAGRLEQERMYGYHDLQRLAAYGRADHPLWERIGAILAVIHDQLEPEGCPAGKLPSEWAAPEDREVWLHGDFNLVNLCYLESDNTVLVIDWSLSPMLAGACTRGPACLDMAWFLRSLFFLPCRMVFPRRVEEKADRFLGGYVSRSGRDPADGHLARLALKSARLTTERQAHSRPKRVFYRWFTRRLERYVTHGFNYRQQVPGLTHPARQGQ